MRAVRTSRTSRTSRATTTALGLAVVLALAGCSAAGATGGSTADAADAADAEAGGEYEPGPLSAYFERMYTETSQEEMDAQTREVEAITAACMQEAGFDYTPLDPATDGSYSLEESEEEYLDYRSEEYAATEGYGITTWEEEATEEEPVEEYVDPNEDYVAAMSEGEQAAFYEALYGPAVDEEYDPEAEPVAYDWTTAGCSGKAQHEVYEGEDPLADPRFAALNDEINTFYESLATHPGVAELDAEWAACMADAGYAGYTSQQDAMTDISDRANALWEQVTEASPEPDQAAMDELQQVEIDTAVADQGCREDVDYDERQQEVTVAAEQEFVDAHRDELEAMVAAHGQGS